MKINEDLVSLNLFSFVIRIRSNILKNICILKTFVSATQGRKSCTRIILQFCMFMLLLVHLIEIYSASSLSPLCK